MDTSLIPDSAPFTPAQRAWLNGFLAGWLGVPSSNLAAVPESVEVQTSPPSQPETEPEPWHDPALPLDERLALAGGKPLPQRLMAAMAQLDCGTCGYVCRTYAEAIDSGAECSLTLCSPGGQETARALKSLVRERAAGRSVPNAPPVAAVENGWSRQNPYTATFLHSECLSGPESEKDTRHVEIGLGSDGPVYEVGDSLGVYPENCPELVSEILQALGASGDELVDSKSGGTSSVSSALLSACCLREITDELVESLADSAGDSLEAEALRRLRENAPHDDLDILDLLRRFPSARLTPARFVASLAPMRPRLYSISSSPRRHPGQVHLTVRKVAYESNGRLRKGVASSMFADRIRPGSLLRVFVQKSHGFRPPVDPSAPLIMIGPGTGIAPFRAFLQDRDARGHRGRTWLFFGDQRSRQDFLYESELRDLQTRGILTRLDTAFSRDQEHKVYVQDRIEEHSAEIYSWLEDGAHLYLCGDARRMAVDVDRALLHLIMRHSGRDAVAARSYLAELTSSNRYLRDVY